MTSLSVITQLLFQHDSLIGAITPTTHGPIHRSDELSAPAVSGIEFARQVTCLDHAA